MDLRPLYDVKERLEQAAIAGTGLLEEDFRLQRGAEGLKALAGASPVFGKISAGLDRLLAANAEERSGLLLDLLALVDAVVFTQARSGVSGELISLPVGGGAYLPLSYSRLQPLLSALTTTGGGRLETIRGVWDDHPEFFSDFRVLPALISGLGDSYAELADLNMTILKSQGPAAVPLLKADFDPAGKKEMARRVEAIAAIEGANATPWLREILPEAKKDVRAAVITALGNDPENIPLLLDLSKTERGASRDAVLTALARLDGEAVQAFWTAEIKKKPTQVEFLKDSSTVWASELAAAAFRAALESPLRDMDQYIQFTSEDMSALNCCRPAVLGRSSPAMLDCWRWIDSQLPVFSKLERSPSVKHIDLGSALPDWLLSSLCAAGPGPLCELCRELWERDRNSPRYLPHAVIAALLTRPAADAYAEFLPYMERSAKVRNAPVLKTAFQHLFRDRNTGFYWASHDYYTLVPNSRQMTALPEPLDRRWFDLLFQVPDMEDILRRLVPPDDPELRSKLAAYQYRKILEGGHFIQEDVAYLRKHGWTQWKGFLDKKVRKDGSLTSYAVVRLLNETSLTGPEKAEELRNLYRIVQAQHIATKRPSWPEQRVMEQIAFWEAE